MKDKAHDAVMQVRSRGTGALPLRQIHLDFHTPGVIDGIGAQFDPMAFAGTLRDSGVDSINLFAKCHHGYSYHDTQVGQRHPGLKYDLLRAQYDACRAAGIGVQIYVSAGWDELMAQRHPEWRKLDSDGKVITFGGQMMTGGWLELCFNTGYLDYLCAQITEVVTLFPDCDGIWLDILHQDDCFCPTCLADMQSGGGDPMQPGIAATQMRRTRQLYLERTVAAARVVNPDMPVFHNMGHAPRGDRSPYPYYSHLELESLPTGGWGYDHFPLSAAYAQRLGLHYLGMTGRFNTLWGEFGGVKHPNALRYECAAIVAYGGAVSIGDHLHPGGRLDPDAYAAIGAAYADIGAKAPWLRDGSLIRADLAVYSRSAQVNPGLSQGEARHDPVDSAVSRALLESGVLFHLIDQPQDLSDYRAVILPDEIVFDSVLAAAVRDFVSKGGRVLLTGTSGLDETGQPTLDIGASHAGPSPYDPDFVSGVMGMGMSPIVIYGGSQRLKPTTGRVLGHVHDPYLQRHGTSHYGHLHAPARLEPTEFAAAIEQDGIISIAHKLFRSYGQSGAVSQRQYLQALLEVLLQGERVLQTTLPSNGRATVLAQPEDGRDIVHLLYAPLMSRGSFKGKPIEVIEDVPPLFDIQVSLRPRADVTAITLVPSGGDLPFQMRDGYAHFVVPRLDLHQMVEVTYRSDTT